MSTPSEDQPSVPGERASLKETGLWQDTEKAYACGREVVRVVSIVKGADMAKAMLKNWTALVTIKQAVLRKMARVHIMHDKVGVQVGRVEAETEERIKANQVMTREIKRERDAVRGILDKSESELYFLKQAVAREEEKQRDLRDKMMHFIEGFDQHHHSQLAEIEEDRTLNIDHYIDHNMEAVCEIERQFQKTYRYLEHESSVKATVVMPLARAMIPVGESLRMMQLRLKYMMHPERVKTRVIAVQTPKFEPPKVEVAVDEPPPLQNVLMTLQKDTAADERNRRFGWIPFDIRIRIVQFPPQEELRSGKYKLMAEDILMKLITKYHMERQKAWTLVRQKKDDGAKSESEKLQDEQDKDKGKGKKKRRKKMGGNAPLSSVDARTGKRKSIVAFSKQVLEDESASDAMHETPGEFLIKFLKSTYGLQSLVDLHCIQLMKSCLYYYRSHKRVRLFADLIGMKVDEELAVETLRTLGLPDITSTPTEASRKLASMGGGGKDGGRGGSTVSGQGSVVAPSPTYDFDDDDEYEEEGFQPYHQRFVLRFFTNMYEWGFIDEAKIKDHDGLLQVSRADAIERTKNWLKAPFENNDLLKELLAFISRLPPPRMYLRSAHKSGAQKSMKSELSHLSLASDRSSREKVDPATLVDLDDYVSEVVRVWSEQAGEWCEELSKRFDQEARWFQLRRNGLWYEVDGRRAAQMEETKMSGESPPRAVVDLKELTAVMLRCQSQNN
eukprot:g1112.t1